MKADVQDLTFSPPAIERRTALGFLIAAYMLSVADRMILSVLFEPIKAEFSLSDTQLGLLGGLTFALFYATLGIPLAKYADRNDRRRLIAACLILFSAMTAFSGLAAGFLMLIFFRVMVGVGEAGVNPASQAMIADYYPRHQRSLAMSSLTAGGNLGMIFGFLAGGMISQIYGWRAAFFAVGIPGIFLGIMILLFLKEPKRGGAEVSRDGTTPSQATIVDALKYMFASPILRQVLAASTVSGMVTYGILQWLPAYFGRVHELPQGRVGLVMAFFIGVIGAIGTLTGGRLTDVLTRKRVDYGVLMIAATQVIAIPLFIAGYLSGSMVVSLAFLVLPFMMLTFYLGPSLALIQTYTPVEMRSLGAAIKMLCLNLVGLSLGPLVIGLISDALEPTMGARGLAIALSCMAVFSVWSAFHFWLAGKAMRKHEERATSPAAPVTASSQPSQHSKKYLEGDLQQMSAIKSIDTTLVRVPSGTPYQMGGMERGASHAISVIVRVETEEGVEGWGETFLTPGWYGADTPASMIWLIDHIFGPRLKGVSVFDTEAIEARMQKLWQLGNWYPKGAIEIAVRDAAARSAGLPLHAMMGGAFRDRFPMSGGIGTASPEAMATKAAAFKERGFKTVKLKIDSVHELELDVPRVREVRQAVGPDMNIRLDGNGVYSVPHAIRLCGRIEEFGIESIEQPVQAHDLKGMAEIRQAISIPLMADESVETMHDALAVIEHRAADIIKLKVSKCGGLGPSRRIADLCKAADIDVTVGNGFNTSLLATAELQLACSASAVVPAGEFIGPDKLEDDICEVPMAIENGDAILPKGPGLGVEISREKLEKYKTTLDEATAALT